jgi:hypothetical protein
MEGVNPNIPTKEEEKTFILEENDFQKLSKIFLINLDAGEVMEKYHPKLKTIYDNRAFHYINNEDMKNQLSKYNFLIYL